MTTGESNIVDIAGDLRHETKKAYLIFDGTKEVWLAKSLVEKGDNGTFAMPTWLAHEKGLI